MSGYSSSQLFDTLKQILKKKKISYKSLSSKISFSESTLKNIFHSKNASVERIIEICDAIDLSFPELVTLSNQDDNAELTFTWEQEDFFSKNPHYYYFFREHFFEKKTLEEIQKEYGLSTNSITQYLLKLEKLGLLEVHPGNKTKFLVRGKLKWIQGGPWTKTQFPIYSKKMTELVCANLENPDYYSSLTGFFSLPEESLKQYIRDIQLVEKKYKEHAYHIHLYNKGEKRVPVSWTFNIVPFDLFNYHSKIIEL